MSIIIPANSAAGGGLGYQVANGVRFDDGSSSSFSDQAPGGNRQKFTWSAWFKRSSIGATQILASSSYSGSDQGYLYFNSGNGLGWQSNNSGDGDLNTARLFRDTSAWSHIVFSVDTTQGTATNRIKLYINGSQYTWDGSNTTPPNQNQSLYFNVGGSYNTYIGRRAGGDYFDGYMSEIVFIDNAQLAADSFGEFDEDSGIWKPIDVSGLTFGTSGYYLNFQNSGALGTDVSGVGNTFTANNLAAIDQTTDSCTNNFATLNPLYKQDGVFSEANLAYTISASDFDSALSTIAPSLGKWYFETKITAQAGSNTTRSAFGICDVRDGNLIAEDELGQNPSGRLGDTLGYAGNGAGNVLKNGSDQGSGFNITYGTNDILSCAVDLDNGAVYYRKNGSSWFNSGNPESGSSRTGAVTITTGQEYVFGNTAYASSAFIMNFGNPAYAISSGNTDGNDRGNFEYAVPSGYLSLCSANLSEVLS